MSTDRRNRPDDSEGESGNAERNENERGIDRNEEEVTSGPEGDESGEPRAGGQTGGRRDVVVPRELYKIVTVFSTLIAIVTVVGGFVLLDTATNRTLAAASDVNLPLAIVAVGLIVLGAATYAFAARFRTGGMGSPNNDADGESENG